MIFHDREDAGKTLSAELIAYKDDPNAIVLALPRGGVVVGFEVAQVLNLPLDIVVTRKIGAPQNPEYAIGAITEDGRGIFDQKILESYEISSDYLLQEIEKERKEAKRRMRIYRGNLTALDLQNKIVILVDDGIATAATMKAAIASIKAKNPSRVIVAVPVAARDSLEKIRNEVDEIVVFYIPSLFMAVGQFYEDFPQTTDQEVIHLLQKSRTFY